jgi:hypothetical protein
LPYLEICYLSELTYILGQYDFELVRRPCD